MRKWIQYIFKIKQKHIWGHYVQPVHSHLPVGGSKMLCCVHSPKAERTLCEMSKIPPTTLPSSCWPFEKEGGLCIAVHIGIMGFRR